MKIALDAMGGDFGPPNLVGGAPLALREYSRIKKLYLVGDTPKIEAELTKLGCTDNRVEIVHATQVVDMSDRAWSAVRRKKDSSVSRAFDLVKHGDADAVVSAGHTGASVAGDRSTGYRGRASHRNECLRFDRCRREYRCTPGTSSSIRIHGLGLFTS